METDLKQVIRSLGLKATPGRIKILAFLSNCRKPVSIKDIARAVGSKNLDLATVYRTLETFRKMGVVKVLNLHSEFAYYELNAAHHHHLICKKCGLVEDFSGCNSEGVIKHALKQSKNFKSINEHSFELFGVCRSCAA